MRMQPKKPKAMATAAQKPKPEVEPLDVDRRELAAKYMPLALATARKFAYGWGWIREEMESAALVALVEAARTYDPARNVRFATFLRKRLIGALLDTRRLMCQSFARLDPEDFDDIDDPNWVRTKSLSNLSPDEVLDFEERIVGDTETTEEMPLCEVHDSLRVEFLRLPPRNREVMDGIYVQHLSFDEIAVSLRCSKPRVVAIHRESLDMLLNDRDALDDRPKRRRSRRGADPSFPSKTQPDRERL